MSERKRTEGKKELISLLKKQETRQQDYNNNDDIGRLLKNPEDYKVLEIGKRSLARTLGKGIPGIGTILSLEQTTSEVIIEIVKDVYPINHTSQVILEVSKYKIMNK